jgi:hypothetical protein
MGLRLCLLCIRCDEDCEYNRDRLHREVFFFLETDSRPVGKEMPRLYYELPRLNAHSGDGLMYVNSV